MLEIVLYDSLEESLLSLGSNKNQKFICPMPQSADKLRSIFPLIDVVTISKWVTDSLRHSTLKKVKKSELMLELASVWKHYFKENDGDLFFKAFELFTEIRSHSLDLDLLSEFINEQDEAIRKSILLFWTYVDQEKLVDEHLSYQLIGVQQNLEDEIGDLCFIDFKHMSAVQIDMIKSLAENRKITIFFPKAVYLESDSKDWIHWIRTDLKVEKTIDEKKTLNVCVYPKGKLNYYLKNIIPTVMTDENARYSLILATKALNFLTIQEVINKDMSFKINNESFFSDEITILFDELLTAYSELKISNQSTLDDFLQASKLKSLEDKKYKKFKIIDLVLKIAENYFNIKDELDFFTLRVFKEVVLLNSPRISSISLQNNLNANQILDLSKMSLVKKGIPSIVVASSKYTISSAAQSKFPEKLINLLMAIGPVKSSKLEFSFIKYELISLLSSSDLNLLMLEEGLDESDISWQEFLGHFNLNKLSHETIFFLKEAIDPLLKIITSDKNDVSKKSASRLQSYSECARKYYFQYVDKMEVDLPFRLMLSPADLGVIEHEVIKTYFNGLKEYNKQCNVEKLKELCEEAVRNYLIKNNISIAEAMLLENVNDVVGHASVGIDFILGYIKDKNVEKIEFEVKLPSNSHGINGAIDCLIKFPDRKISVFDFKRSGTSIGPKKDTLQFKKLQIWIYVTVLSESNYEIIDFGYVNLSDPEAHQIYSEAEFNNPNFNQYLASFNVHLRNIIENYNNETLFRPKPIDEKSCSFCPVSEVCPRDFFEQKERLIE